MPITIEKAQNKCLSGQLLSRDEIVDLLSIPIHSDKDKELRLAAREVAAKIGQNKGYIWSAIGLDFAPCSMNCQFCSFGEKWGIVKQSKICSEEEILSRIKIQVENGAHYIVLRTTEFFSINDLIELTKHIKKTIEGTYRIVLNVGEFDLAKARLMHECGIWGVYHAIRLREGVDTNFKIEARQKTQKAVIDSPLQLITLAEPIGIEHSNTEIADIFLTNVIYQTTINGAMARVPVAGTPLGCYPALPSERLAQIVATLRLSGGNLVQDICVHPANLDALQSGANVMVVETGAIPRDTVYAVSDWEKRSIETAHALLTQAGYNTRHHFEK